LPKMEYKVLLKKCNFWGYIRACRCFSPAELLGALDDADCRIGRYPWFVADASSHRPPAQGPRATEDNDTRA
jgi:hypothetical protein